MKTYPLNRVCLDCKARLKHYSSKRCRSCSKKGTKRIFSLEHKHKIAEANRRRKYKPHTEETKEKIRLSKEKYMDCVIEHPTYLRKALYGRWCWRKWKREVLKDFDYMCLHCGEVAEDVHHKVTFIEIINSLGINTIRKAINCRVLWDRNNGVALCKSCHRKEHKKCV